MRPPSVYRSQLRIAQLPFDSLSISGIITVELDTSFRDQKLSYFLIYWIISGNVVLVL